jgi:hypothetical protein
MAHTYYSPSKLSAHFGINVCESQFRTVCADEKSNMSVYVLLELNLIESVACLEPDTVYQSEALFPWILRRIHHSEYEDTILVGGFRQASKSEEAIMKVCRMSNHLIGLDNAN